MRTLGSLTLCRSLLNAGLVDRFRVVIFPVITGTTGRDRIYDGYPDVALDMISNRTFDGRIQLVEYVPTILAGPPGTEQGLSGRSWRTDRSVRAQGAPTRACRRSRSRNGARQRESDGEGRMDDGGSSRAVRSSGLGVPQTSPVSVPSAFRNRSYSRVPVSPVRTISTHCAARRLNSSSLPSLDHDSGRAVDLFRCCRHPEWLARGSSSRRARPLQPGARSASLPEPERPDRLHGHDAIASPQANVAGLCRTAVRWNRDPAQGPRPPVHHHPPRGNAHGLRPSAAGSVGGRVRRARSAPLRVGAAVGRPAPPGDRTDSGMDARRDHDVPVPRCGRPCHGRGKSAERSGPSRGIRCRPGRGGGACRRTRARCCGLRDQGSACGGSRRRD